jgi:hypothetical protein
MAFADLTAPAHLIRTGNDDILTADKYTDAELQELDYEASSFDVKLDLCSAQQIGISNVTALDALYTAYQEQLERALAYKQLFYFYFRQNDGDGSLTHDRMKYYEKMYNKEAAAFGKWRVSSNVFTSTGNIKRG